MGMTKSNLSMRNTNDEHRDDSQRKFLSARDNDKSSRSNMLSGGVTEEMMDSVHSLAQNKGYYDWKRDNRAAE